MSYPDSDVRYACEHEGLNELQNKLFINKFFLGGGQFFFEGKIPFPNLRARTRVFLGMSGGILPRKIWKNKVILSDHKHVWAYSGGFFAINIVKKLEGILQKIPKGGDRRNVSGDIWKNKVTRDDSEHTLAYSKWYFINVLKK